jgi:hypothetical protein
MIGWTGRMTPVITVPLLFVVAMVSLILCVVPIIHMLRARAMRAFAIRLGFRYIGPPLPPKWWWNPSHLEIGPSLPGWISHFHPCGERIRQVWNVIEGEQNGALTFIFDGIVGYRGGHPCTLIACQTEQNPFGMITSADRIVRSYGWTVLHGVWFGWFSWTMGIRRIDSHVKGLRRPTAPVADE